MTTRILLAEDHRILRQGVRALLSREPGIEVVGEAATADEAVEMAHRLKPDVVVMESIMPGIGGLEAARRIREQLTGTRIIALSRHSERQLVVQMIRAGASGYLGKDSTFEDLKQAVRNIMSGRPYLSAELAGALVDDLAGLPAVAPRSASSDTRVLTARETEVLSLLADGKRVKDVARILGISAKTVESHRQNMMDKLGIHSTVELTRYALREGLINV